jgi:hypothetical protein
MQEQIKSFAVKVIGMTDAEVQSLFTKTDDGEEKLIDNFAEILAKKDEARISRLKELHKAELTEIHDKGYKKAVKEVLPKFESDVKAKFGIETDKIGIDLISELVEKNKSASADNGDIKTHPEYIKLERKLNTEFVPKTELDTVAESFEMFKKTVERDKVISKVKDDARKVFKSLNPILSKDPVRASNQESEFLRKLDSFDYQVQDDGNHVILKDGKRIENANLNPVAFPEFVKQKTLELFDIAEQDTKGNSGVDNSGGSSQSVTFKDITDYDKRYDAETDPQKRVAMYNAAKKQGLI